MSEFDGIDFFRGNELVADPYPYYEYLRAQCPVQREPHHDVMMVTGYDEAVSVYTDTATFSSCNAVTGPFPGFPVPLEGDDVSELIEQHREELPFSDQILTMDPPKHKAHRGMLMRLITPKRLKENEDFMWRHADRQIDEFVARGECEFIRDYAGPFTLYVIADLLGVPEADHEWFRQELQGGHRPETQGLGSTGSGSLGHSPLEFLYERLTAYVEDRRREPRNDVLTGLATATFPDGSTPEVIDVVRVAANVFSAGQETTVRLLAAAFQLIGERPELQQLLREDRGRIPGFVEEVLRMEGPVKGDFRLSRQADHGRGRRDPGRHDRHGGQRRRGPRPPALRGPGRVPRGQGERQGAPGLRTRAARLSRGTAGPCRGAHQHRAAAGTHGGHQDLRGGARHGWRQALRVRPHLHPPRPPAPPTGVHPARVSQGLKFACPRQPGNVSVFRPATQDPEGEINVTSSASSAGSAPSACLHRNQPAWQRKSFRYDTVAACAGHGIEAPDVVGTSSSRLSTAEPACSSPSPGAP